MPSAFFLIEDAPPAWVLAEAARGQKNHKPTLKGYLALVLYPRQENREENAEAVAAACRELFPRALSPDTNVEKLQGYALLRAFKRGVSNPLCSSLATLLKVEERYLRVDRILLSDTPWSPEAVQALEAAWREPAIEELRTTTLAAWQAEHQKLPMAPQRRDDSFDAVLPEAIGLDFTPEERAVLDAEAQRQNRAWTRAEWELFAQSWSEHCKHKIFAAKIELSAEGQTTESLFKTHIRGPTMEILKREPGRCLSVFHDNAGVLPLQDASGADTPWAIALKMETHNSPSAISPYGGASTGLVGVHRDILGTGQGAMPIANWDVLCFESPQHNEARPATALSPDLIRRGVIKGIEDGGNQSGIPTAQGSVVFDPAYAVKPLVYAGSVGLLPRSRVDKKPRAGLTLYCVGGAVGLDGLRGAVMSSRDLRADDFSGSAVQVANAFTQRRMTDFLLVARERDLLDVISDNGAGGLASSCGEMAGLTGGARIDLSKLRLKYEGLLAWERLLSESQERMTLGTARPEELEALARQWDVPFDRLGELNGSGRFVVSCGGRTLVDVGVEFLHGACPTLQLKSSWTQARETEALTQARAKRPQQKGSLRKDFARMLTHPHLCSREGIARRFDHGVQGRTLRKIFQGSAQHAPGDGSVLEIYENRTPALVALAHGLAPWRGDIVENTLHSFDECLRQAVLAGADLRTAGMLDNFSWPDPIPAASKSPTENTRAERHLWRLVRCCETLSTLCRTFEIPLISGKDSMKNNSRDFDAPATIVISLGASVRAFDRLPAAFFCKPNDVMMYVPPLKATLRDSAWERCLGASADHAPAVPLARAEVGELAGQLHDRYKRLQEQIAKGHIRGAKDIGEGGLLMAAFEMCLGRELGAYFEVPADDASLWLSEGLGGFVLGLDPHMVKYVEAALPEARRLGVVQRPPVLRWDPETETVDLKAWRELYLQATQEGFWA